MKNIEYLKPSLQKRQKRRDKRLGEELIECSRNWCVKPEKGSYKNRMKKDHFAQARRQEGMKFMHHGGTKHLADNLEPLIRFLNSQRGKNWNKVYKELCSKLDKRTLPGLHVFNHLWDFVVLHVVIEGKKVYYMRFGRYEELISREKWPKFFVHPNSGQLLKARLNNQMK